VWGVEPPRREPPRRGNLPDRLAAVTPNRRHGADERRFEMRTLLGIVRLIGTFVIGDLLLAGLILGATAVYYMVTQLDSLPLEVGVSAALLVIVALLNDTNS
jgi:hypothetical protein